MEVVAFPVMEPSDIEYFPGSGSGKHNHGNPYDYIDYDEIFGYRRHGAPE